MKFLKPYPPADRGVIIVWGLLALLPFGGLFWQVLHHLVGFRRLGFDVWYVEDSDRLIYDTTTWMLTSDYAQTIRNISKFMSLIGMEDRWVFRHPQKETECSGATDFKGLLELYKRADAAFNLCGAQEVRPYHDVLKCRVLLETDPVAPQIKIALGDPRAVKEYERYQYIFSYGENMGSDDCVLPLERFRWFKTRPPVITDLWNPNNEPPKRKMLTTIANWDTDQKGIEWRGRKYYWQKDFTRFLDLPSKSAIPIELALGRIGANEKLKIHNKKWLTCPAGQIEDLDHYHDYICQSMGEFTVAKDSYVRTRSGWFSDRSVCYLAAGRPVITEDTAFSKYIPSGEGLFGFSSESEILSAVDAIKSNYQKQSRRAKEIAEDFFSSDVVLRDILKTVGLC